MMVACQSGHVEIARLLEAFGAMAPIQAERGEHIGWTALHFAVRAGHMDAVRYLVAEQGMQPSEATEVRSYDCFMFENVYLLVILYA